VPGAVEEEDYWKGHVVSPLSFLCSLTEVVCFRWLLSGCFEIALVGRKVGGTKSGWNQPGEGIGQL
jgi:hypothetical protein